MREYYKGHAIYFETQEEAERFRLLYPELFTHTLGFFIGLYHTNVAYPNRYQWCCAFQSKRGVFEDIKDKLKLTRKPIGHEVDGRVRTGWCFRRNV